MSCFNIKRKISSALVDKAEKQHRSADIYLPGKISAQPHPTLCIQLLGRENNDTEILPKMSLTSDFTLIAIHVKI